MGHDVADTTGFRALFGVVSAKGVTAPPRTGYDMRLTNLVTKLSAAAAMIFTGASAGAQAVNQELEIVGAPIDGGIAFQPAASELARDLQWLDNMILVIITAVTLGVILLMTYVIVRYNRRANPTPSTFTHNSPLEVAWTIVPIVILVVIGSFSLPVLFKQQIMPEADINIKVTGYQWYWGYEYVDDGVAYDSFMIGYGEGNLNDNISAQLAEAGYSDREFRLAVDNAVVVPVGKTIVMTVTGADVIHSWTIPAFGVKQDAVPGRLAQLWFAAEREGIYFGQCSELCGKDHAYMPITVKVVSQETYDAWLIAAKEQHGV